MPKQKKFLLLGGVGVVAAFLLVQWLVIQGNWTTAQKERENADAERANWDKFFKPGTDLVARPQAEEALKESNDKLRKQLNELKKIEIGTAETLFSYSVAAAGTGDKSNYLKSMQRKLNEGKARDLGVAVPVDLGFDDRTLGEPVALNLLRLAILERLLTACKEAGVPQVLKIQFGTTHEAPGTPEDPEEEQADNPKKKLGKEQPAKVESIEKLLQFPIRVKVTAVERAIEHLLFELQHPSDDKRCFFCILGFHVNGVAGSGKVECELALAALLGERTAAKLEIQLKAADEPRRRLPVNDDMDR